MHKRAEQVDQTRERIVEAAVRLHGTVGPAGTSIAGIAREAGVTRLTVYRHFEDDDAIFAACSAHWLAGQRPPNPAAWALVGEPLERLKAGLADLYRFFEEGQEMLFRIYRDLATLPDAPRRAIEDRDAAIRRVLIEAFGDDANAGVIAAVGHATSFWTWHSLCVEHALPTPDAVDLMSALVATALERAGSDASGDGTSHA
jgi:AcrR family transcriptional regulator